jgi:hypothetical protein
MHKILYILPAIIVVAGGFISCRREPEPERIELPATPVLSIRANWGVVKSPFLRIREDPFQRGDILAHLRKGSILEISSRTENKEILEDVTGYWFQVNYEGLRGWVFGAYLEIFDSSAKARQYADGL